MLIVLNFIITNYNFKIIKKVSLSEEQDIARGFGFEERNREYSVIMSCVMLVIKMEF